MIAELATIQGDLVDAIITQLKADTDLKPIVRGNVLPCEDSRIIPLEVDFPLIQVKDCDVNFETNERSTDSENPILISEIYFYDYIRNLEPEIHVKEQARKAGLVLKALYAKRVGRFYWAMPVSVSTCQPVFIAGDEEEAETVLMTTIVYKHRTLIKTYPEDD